MPKLLTLPLRVARGTIEIEIWLVRMGIGLVRGIVDPDSTRVPPPAPQAMEPEPEPRPQPMAEPPRPQGDKLAGARRRQAPKRAPRRRAAPRPQARPEPDETVASVGPAAHAGPEIHVDAPWEGYDEMALQDILARLEKADEAAVAVVRLYEARHENRQAILLATGAEP
jgi:hypothetical protein